MQSCCLYTGRHQHTHTIQPRHFSPPSLPSTPPRPPPFPVAPFAQALAPRSDQPLSTTSPPFFATPYSQTLAPRSHQPPPTTPRPLPSLLLLQLRQCMTDLADMSSEQIHWEYGYPALRMADALRNRSRDMLQHGELQGHVWGDLFGRTCAGSFVSATPGCDRKQIQ